MYLKNICKYMHLPIEFIERTKSLLNKEWDSFVESLNDTPPTSIRLNSTKAQNFVLDSDSVLWCRNGYYLDQRPQFTFDPLFHAGCYYVQEASSMFIEQALEQYVDKDACFLDLCAAPGGKSTLIADWLSGKGLLLSNEVIKSRANILAENITKCGYSNVIVTNNDPVEIGEVKHFFDAILVDAPCSGEGMFRKDTRAIEEWSVANVQLCKERQQRILADVWNALKPGGFLLYSTCTYNREENEENVQWIAENLGADILSIDINKEWGIAPSYTDTLPAYHFFPHKTKGEGFFFALLRKHENEECRTISRPKDKNNRKNTKQIVSDDIKKCLRNEDNFIYSIENDVVSAFPDCLKNELAIITANLNIVYSGICIGMQKGKDFIPDQSLALSNDFNRDMFPVAELDWKTAISYLKKEVLDLSEMPRGYIILVYRNIPLGFVKNIGNRANNLYPQEWRIRSNNIPVDEVQIL